jgi:hypothetical protein
LGSPIVLRGADLALAQPNNIRETVSVVVVDWRPPRLDLTVVEISVVLLAGVFHDPVVLLSCQVL